MFGSHRMFWILLAAFALATVTAAACGGDDDDDDHDYVTLADEEDGELGVSCEKMVNAMIECDAEIQGGVPEQIYEVCVTDRDGYGCLAEAYEATEQPLRCSFLVYNIREYCAD
ncbi:MAG: hypothetical protein H6684_15470 [Deltaproteobacteria bacterium]|nr:hypothetical protein [bacterium]MCB9475727.1 hypothetical protein [Deltaproteobacteria bacterium]MCB9479249.1 hypothetical protein [Deltaproteobacteria bacterium]MCB9490129.1 hypothetical protein [Deltaproteobacteria bacterium]